MSRPHRVPASLVITILVLAALGIRFLIDRSTPEPDPREAAPSAPSHQAPPSSSGICEAAEEGNDKRVLDFLENGSDANSICKGDDRRAARPLLSVAAQQGTLDTVQALLKAGARVNAPNAYGFTALHQAAVAGQLAAAKALLDAGASVRARTSTGGTVLHSAVLSNSLIAGTTCRTRAAMVQLLLSAGADVNAAEEYHITPLHDAARDCVEVVRQLVEAGANVNAVEDWYGDTPLMRALDRNSVSAETVTVLLDAGANPLLPNREGENAVRRASGCGNAQVYRMVADRARLFMAQ